MAGDIVRGCLAFVYFLLVYSCTRHLPEAHRIVPNPSNVLLQLVVTSFSDGLFSWRMPIDHSFHRLAFFPDECLTIAFSTLHPIDLSGIQRSPHAQFMNLCAFHRIRWAIQLPR